MIFYFSGTGNSQLAAKKIADITEDELISINQQLRENQTGAGTRRHICRS